MTTYNRTVPGGYHYPTVVAYDSAAIGQFSAGNGDTYGLARLPGEAIGTTTLSLTNIVSGSRYRIEVASTGALASPSGSATGTYTSGALDITLDLFAPGSDENALRIKVRNATGTPKYKPFETQATLSAAAQSVFVGQIED